MRTLFGVVMLWMVASPMPVLASSPGDLDPTFNNGGVARAPAGGYARALALQPDGRLVTGGWAREGIGSWDFGLVRFNANGSLDRTFGNAGVVTTAIGPQGFNSGADYLNALVLQPDGRLVAAGTIFSSYDRVGLVRYNPDGSLDPTFGSSGIVLTSTASLYDDATALALRPDGRLIAAGSSWSVQNGWNHVLLVSYNPDGSLDTTFGSGGVVTIPLCVNYAAAQALVVQPDGTLVVACSCDTPGSPLALLRINPDGSMDPTFGVGGIASGGPGPTAMIRQADGKLVVAGLGLNSGRAFALARFNADGTPDAGFGGGTVVLSPGGLYTYSWAVAQQADGKLLVAGEAPSVERFGLARFNTDGTLDTTFGDDGIASPETVDGLPGDQVRALALLPDGRMVAAGGPFVVARYLPGTCGNGALDAGEECDDGNTISGDGCDANCTVTRCGNAVTTGGEECDDGNNDMNDECKNGCQRNVCGDAVDLWGVEQCDDGNLNSNDACKNDCTSNVCGDGVIRTGVEQCDDGNRNPNDACTNACTVNVCGDGVLYFRLEQCDDGNHVSGDGCEADCTITGLADAVVLPLKPRTVRLRHPHQQIAKRVWVTVRDGGSTSAGQTIQLTADSDCPAGTVGMPDFGAQAAGAPNLVALSNGASARALVRLTVAADAFATFNRKAPTRCTLTLRATPVAPGGTNDPALSNNSATMELNVIDRTDAEQTAFHQVFMDSTNPISVQLANGRTKATRTIRVRVGNADRGELSGHTSSIHVSDGDCPAGTVGTPNFELGRGQPRSFTTVRGGGTARAVVSLTINAAGFATRSVRSPARCTALLTATGPGGDVDAANDSTALIIDVTDANDF